MYYYGSMPGYAGCPSYGCNCQHQGGRSGYGYALILVLFILLVIIGASRL